MPGSNDRSTKKIEKPKLLLGEGIEEQTVFRSVAGEQGQDELQFGNFGGKTRLRHFISLLPSLPGFRTLTTLGITRDSNGDTDPFGSVCGALSAAGLPVPDRPGEFCDGPPRVGVLIIPPEGPGMLEDLCFKSLEDDPAVICVHEFFDCVRVRAAREPSNMSKALVHAWLSSKETPDLRLGNAAEAGYWNLDHRAFDPLREFIRRM